jgi:Fe-S cluster assembly ATP-binding protein
MLQIENLHAEIDGKQILRGLTLSVGAGEVHAIMGPNGAGKSTLGYVLGGRPGYEVTAGSVVFDGKDLLDMAPDERAAAGLFLGFQYPVEIPGVSNVQFLRTALNAQRRARGEAEMSAGDFLRLARAQGEALDVSMDMMKRNVNVGFSGGEKKRNEMVQMGAIEPAWPCSTRPIQASTSTRCASSATASTASCGARQGGGADHPLSAPARHRAGRTSCMCWPRGGSCASGGPELAHELEREGYAQVAA